MCETCGDITLTKRTPLTPSLMFRWDECLCGIGGDIVLEEVADHGKLDMVMAIWLAYLNVSDRNG